MTQIAVVGEDALCCALGEKLVASLLPGWQLATPSINTKGVTKLVPELPRYLKLARSFAPVLCIADTDSAPCVVDLLKKWLPHGSHSKFLLRLAVTESESWLLADREGFAAFLDMPANKITTVPDELPDAKQHLLNLTRRYAPRSLRHEMLSGNTSNPGPGNGYNIHLGSFVRGAWNPTRASENSPSLRRAILRIQELQTAT